MKIRNKKEFSLYLPYAGPTRGVKIKGGKLSAEIPTTRFYDPLLQRDWKKGRIDVVLSDMDKAILGPAVADFETEEVEVSESEIIENVQELHDTEAVEPSEEEPVAEEDAPEPAAEETPAPVVERAPAEPEKNKGGRPKGAKNKKKTTSKKKTSSKKKTTTKKKTTAKKEPAPAADPIPPEPIGPASDPLPSEPTVAEDNAPPTSLADLQSRNDKLDLGASKKRAPAATIEE